MTAFVKAIGWSLIIFATIPYGRDIVFGLRDLINFLLGTDKGYQYVGDLAAGVIVIVLLWAAWKLFRLRGRLSPRSVAGLTAIAALYGYFLTTMTVPTEKIHFLEYGYLAYLLYRAWDPLLPSRAIWPVIFFSGLFVGTVDETIQYYHPERTGEFNDVMWNGLAVLLPMGMISLFVDNRGSAAYDREQFHLRLWSRIAICSLGLFAITTQDFGIVIDAPLEYRIFSRHSSPDALANSDASFDSHAIAGLSPLNYGLFLKMHDERRDPYLNEFRVHLFRRDRYLGQYSHGALRRNSAGLSEADDIARHAEVVKQGRIYAAHYMSEWLSEKLGQDYTSRNDFRREYNMWIGGGDVSWGDELWTAYLSRHAEKAAAGEVPDEAAQREYLHTAWRENQILENHFSGALSASQSAWPLPLRVFAEETIAPHFYESGVANRIIWKLTRVEIAVLAALLLMLLSPPRLVRPGYLFPLAAAAAGYLIYLHPALFHPPFEVGAETSSYENPSLSLTRSPIPPVIDGKVTEGEWPTNVVTLLENHAALTTNPATVGRITFDDGNLYIALVCYDTSITNGKIGRDGDLWRNDAVEIFLDTTSLGKEYAEIELSPQNEIYDALIQSSSEINFDEAKRWSLEGLETRTSIGEDEWTAELRIPLKSLGIDEATLARGIRMNLYRIDTDSDEAGNYRYQAWSPTFRWFHVPKRFGAVHVRS